MFRKKLYGDVEFLDPILDEWLEYCNIERTHPGKKCYRRTPMQTLEGGCLK